MGAVGDRESITAAFDALDSAVDEVLGLDCQALSATEWLALVERVERVRRRLPAIEHPLINLLSRHATPEELGGKLAHAIADWALISRPEAARRIRHAADLGPRRALTGQPLAPILAATAAAQRDGKLGPEQVTVIRNFYHQLPGWVDTATREQAEAKLASDGAQYRPDYLEKNPNHAVPLLEIELEDGTSLRMIESGAIVQWLADAVPEKRLAPPPGPSAARADYLQMLQFGAIHVDMMRVDENTRIDVASTTAESAAATNTATLSLSSATPNTL